MYRNHALLSDEDEEIFQLVESYKAQGGVCVSGAGGGPAEGEDFEDADRPHIPSNLEVDPESWYTNEVTFSPFFEPKGIMASDDASATTTLGGKTILELSDRVVVESCYDETSKAMDMTVRFKGMEATSDDVLPWMAVGYRETVADVDPMAHKTELLPSAKVGEASVFASMYAAMTPLGDVEGYADVMVEAGDDEVALSFKQEVGAMPEEDVYMLFAIGMGAELGYHTTRGCFQVKATPCGSMSSTWRLSWPRRPCRWHPRPRLRSPPVVSRRRLRLPHSVIGRGGTRRAPPPSSAVFVWSRFVQPPKRPLPLGRTKHCLPQDVGRRCKRHRGGLVVAPGGLGGRRLGGSRRSRAYARRNRSS